MMKAAEVWVVRGIGDKVMLAGGTAFEKPRATPA